MIFTHYKIIKINIKAYFERSISIIMPFQENNILDKKLEAYYTL